MVEKIKKLQDIKLRKEMGTAGRKFILKSFDKNIIYKNLEDYILNN